jgi:hypothetical protein
MLSVILCCETDVKITVITHLKITVKVEKVELSEREINVFLI